MDLKTLLNNLHEELSCSVCMTTFTDPKQLPCLHSFCLHCLEEILRTSGRRGIIACPECRRESRVPSSGSLKDLPTNFRINSLLDVLAIKESNTTEVKCGNCDKKSSHSFYCFQCCAFWCDVCIIAHNTIRPNKDHRVLAIKDFQDQDIEDVLKRPAFCKTPGHDKRQLEFFCKNCVQPICHSCAATIHGDGHAKILLEEAANERRAEAKSMIDSQKKMAQQMRNKIFQIDQHRAKIEGKAANVKKSVEQFAENISAIIMRKKLEIMNEVENQERQSLQQLGIQRNAIEQQAQKIETGITKTETLLKQNTSTEIAQLDHSTLKTIFQEEIRSEEEQVDCDLEGLRRFIFVENETFQEKAIAEGIGSFKTFLPRTRAQQSDAEGEGINEAVVGLEAQFVLTTRNVKREQCYDERDCVTVEFRNQRGQACTTKARVHNNKDGSYNIIYFAKETGECRVSAKVNEEHVQGSPFVVQIKHREFQPVYSFGKEGSAAGMLRNPWGVAVNERDEIAVTDNGNNRVQLFSSDGTCFRLFGRRGHKQKEFDFPTGVALDGKNENIFVMDCMNHRVQLFSERGEFLDHFGERGTDLDHQLERPRDLSLDSDGNFIVADYGNKQIKIFSPCGQFLRKIGEKGSFEEPWHCIQYENLFIVSDSKDNSIKVFSREGQFLYKFGKKGEGDGEFKEPRSLSVNKAGHLMVCDKLNHRVQVFELSEKGGNFITKFGTRGSGIGNFNQPLSTAVLSDGRIVVCEFENHRIQIFK